MTDLWSMGGYGGYIWAAYGFTAVVLISLAIFALVQVRRGEGELSRLRQQVRARPQAPTATLTRRDASASQENSP
ncbi:MAG: heme exporter protein CcmD [Geminicoccaceae bacterium]